MTETAPDSRTQRGRAPARVHGVLSINKSAGMTSFDVVRAVRRILDERRVGHAGTLDPTATGMLPVCVGQATRLVDHFHHQPKRYHCVVRLGERSDTLDTEGRISPGATAAEIREPAVREALQRFVGEVTQVPPMHSAVRTDGRHLYELARQGISVERAARPVVIHSAELITMREGRVAEVEIDVLCGKGTYMRVLAADLGEALGTGGMLAWLERTAYGSLDLSSAITLDELGDLDDPSSALLPAAVAVEYLPRVDLAPPLALQLRRGQSVWVPKLPEPRPQGACRAHGASGDLLALAELQGNLLRPTKVMAVTAGAA